MASLNQLINTRKQPINRKFKKLLIKFKTIEKKEDIPNLKQAQEFVEGWVERLKLPNGDTMLFNEEGAIKNFPVNEKASKFILNVYPDAIKTPISGNKILPFKSISASV